MVSRKRSAQAKRVAAFKESLYDGGAGADAAFERERVQSEERARQHEAALRRKACESKNRYACESDARAAIQSCADHGTTGLHAYRCPYCKGWPLTSKPMRS